MLSLHSHFELGGERNAFDSTTTDKDSNVMHTRRVVRKAVADEANDHFEITANTRSFAGLVAAQFRDDPADTQGQAPAPTGVQRLRIGCQSLNCLLDRGIVLSLRLGHRSVLRCSKDVAETLHNRLWINRIDFLGETRFLLASPSSRCRLSLL